MSRPRKPLAVLKVEGGYRGDRHAGRKDQPAAGQLEPPVKLNPRTSKLWKRIAPQLALHGCGQCDLPLLELLLHYWDQWQLAKESDPAAAGTVRLSRECERLLRAFGFSPSDRQKITQPDAPPSELEELLA